MREGSAIYVSRSADAIEPEGAAVGSKAGGAPQP